VKLLADQNVHRRVVRVLREAGFDLEFIQETMPGSADEAILARNDISDFILITGDRDFGDLIFNKGLPQPNAILYSRLPHPEWQNTANRLIAILRNGPSPGYMTTLTKDGERLRSFPLGATHD
jgi:predicted nuclease of predicted toxin-antitoxin system